MPLNEAVLLGELVGVGEDDALTVVEAVLESELVGVGEDDEDKLGVVEDVTLDVVVGEIESDGVKLGEVVVVIELEDSLKLEIVGFTTTVVLKPFEISVEVDAV